jgi:hypothetical protein
VRACKEETERGKSEARYSIQYTFKESVKMSEIPVRHPSIEDDDGLQIVTKFIQLRPFPGDGKERFARQESGSDGNPSRFQDERCLLRLTSNEGTDSGRRTSRLLHALHHRLPGVLVRSGEHLLEPVVDIFGSL